MFYSQSVKDIFLVLPDCFCYSFKRAGCGLELHLQMTQLLLPDALSFRLPACSIHRLSEVTDTQLGCQRDNFKVF